MHHPQVARASEMATPPLPILSFGDGQPPSESDLPPFPTILLPQGADSNAGAKPGGSSGASSASSSTSSNIDLAHVARTVLKAKRVAVVCGALLEHATMQANELTVVASRSRHLDCLWDPRLPLWRRSLQEPEGTAPGCEAHEWEGPV